MYKGKCLCIVAMLMLTTVGIAQDKDRNPSEKQLGRDRIQQAAQDRMDDFVKQVTDPLVQRVSKSVIQRYNLDQTAVNELCQSIKESAEALLTQPEDLLALITAARKGNYTKMLETLLSHPNCKTAFAKYLNEEQLQEYMDYTLAQEQRGRQAVARHLTAWLDQQLSLTVDQREKMEQRLIANAGKGRPLSPGDMVLNPPRPAGVVRRRFDAAPADVLSQTQSAIWRELIVPFKPKNEWRVRMVEAKLAAHTEQLGPLDESASQRLVLVTKGVVEEYLETQGDILRAKYEEADITHHPLYQQTIEDVLSEEAFAQYKARQAERQRFRQQALRDVLVASIDAQLFLSDEQRKHFEMVAEELSALPAPDEAPAPVYMVHQLFQRTDHALLSPWQRKEFERISTGH